METIGLCKPRQITACVTKQGLSFRSDERWKGTGVFLQCHENLISDDLKT